MVSEEKQAVDLDAVLEEIGGVGRYQIQTILLLCIPVVLCGVGGEYIFTAAAVDHRCHIPECEYGSVDTFAPDWLSNAVPGYPGALDQCSRFQSLNTTIVEETYDVCPASLFDQNTTIPCERYVYENTNTIVYDFQLACQELRRASVGTYKNLGSLFGLPVFGCLSDKIGRRSAMIISLVCIGICGLTKAFSINFEMYVTLGFFEFMLGAGGYSSCFVLATELLGTKYRNYGAFITKSSFTIGQALMATMAWLFPEWRTLTIVIYTPLLFVFVYHWLINDSVRWLLIRGKYEEARSVLRTVARRNGNELSETSLDNLVNATSDKNTLSAEQDSKRMLIKQILSSSIMRKRVFITPVWWITLTLVYYGLSINSVSLAGNMHLNYILVVIVEIPGDISAALLLNRFGRRRALITTCMGCAVSLVVSTFAHNNSWLALSTFLVGKFFISTVVTCVYVYTAELYPTENRHTLLAFSSAIGRIGAIVAPLTPALAIYWTGIPTTIFATMAFLSGCLAFLTPETLHSQLPDTIEEAENIGRNLANK